MTRRRPHRRGTRDNASSPGKRPPKGRAGVRPPATVRRGWRLWGLRILLVFAGPAVFLLLLEGGLSLAGVGYPTSFFIPSEQRGVLTTNLRFGWHYQHQTWTEPVPCLVPVDKPKDAIRIFVLGESAAMGTPDPSFGFARILEIMLAAAFPDQRFEIINAAMRGINSHVLVPIARECAGLDPDLFIVYMGNNELSGLYGPKTPMAFLGRHPALVPAFHWVKQTRTAQVLRRVLGVNPEALQKTRKPPTAEFFREHCTAHDDPVRDYVYANFRRNLERICEYGRQAGAAVVLATVAVNLRDCPPLGSRHRSDLMRPQQEQWEQVYRRGAGCESAGDVLGAISQYQQAAALDDHWAELHFRLARCHLQVGDRDAARRHFRLARDWDALPLRADTRLNEIIREVAAGGGDASRTGGFETRPYDGVPRRPSAQIRLVETETALAAAPRCPDGIPGREFFYEHVHLRFDGDYEVARALWPAVLQGLQDRGRKVAQSVPLPARDQCAKALAFTAWDEVNTAAAMAKLTAQPPFTEQLEHAQRQAAQEQAVSAVTSRIDQAFVQQVIQAYRQAIEARPHDWHLRYNLGAFLHQLERPQEAAVHLDWVVQTFPHVASFRVLLGYALAKAGRPEQAVEQFRQALKRDGRNPEARAGLDRARALRQRPGR